MTTKDTKGFMLIALKAFRHNGLDIKPGDRVGARMTFTHAVTKAKQHNIGQSVGCSKRVKITGYVKFDSSWLNQITKPKLPIDELEKVQKENELNYYGGRA